MSRASPLSKLAPRGVPFTAFGLRNARGLWARRVRRDSSTGAQADPAAPSLDDLARDWGLAVPGGASFRPEHFDLTRPHTLMAEAYGGDGVAANGGGSRAGNLRGMQLKGIGCNPLLGLHTDLRHAYGALYLENAITEAIYAGLVDQLLPHGSVPVQGVLDTGVTVVFDNAATGFRHQGPGGILLREPCLRPAHFLRSPGFVARDPRTGVADDTVRVRSAQRALASLSRGNEGLERVLFDFLTRCAEQFAAARSWRLAHGSMTPSNLSFDGRWLDLSHVSTLPTGFNHKPNPAQPSFLRESMLPLEVATELIYTYNKYNRRRLGADPFLRHYDLTFKTALASHRLRPLGLAPRARAPTAPVLSARVNALIDGSGQVLAGELARHEPAGHRDAWLGFIEAVYRPLLADGSAAEGGSIGNGDSSAPDHACAAELTSLLRAEADAAAGWRGGRWSTHLRSAVIDAHRACAQAVLFRRAHVDALVRDTLARDHAGVGALIDDMADLAGCIWRRGAEDSVLLETVDVRIAYRHDSGRFTLAERGRPACTLNHPKAVLEALEHLPPQQLARAGHDLGAPTRQLLALLQPGWDRMNKVEE